jgi:CDP-diglyceride synthetase
MPSPSSKDSTSQRLVLSLPKSDFSRSVVGFLAALVAGALVPKTIGYLVRRVLLRSFREIFILAIAGWLADFIASMLTRSSHD